MTGLYDHQGVLRFTGRDPADCLDYAELFALSIGSYCLASLEKVEPAGTEPASGVAAGLAAEVLALPQI